MTILVVTSEMQIEQGEVTFVSSIIKALTEARDNQDYGLEVGICLAPEVDCLSRNLCICIADRIEC